MLQENNNLQDGNVLHESKELPKPNLEKFTEDEIHELLNKYYQLPENEQEEKFGEYINRIPVNADLLNYLKGEFGLTFLLENKFNLSEAVDKYGKEWINF